ncbi:uncharacterized protein K460DRAFT_97459 [Cucurbitaria berberidis CBS 394.84]|uniref:Uncharacterized protein n=1 Tax=Cucurbitaria berberidis CBS 394.84 TaxID=1168544 RepID=A0A9P4GGG0_9PLEO|nr:uncharacterized protein K460DRAFT_97459 [Cucurbitaria berberidis CBS 394.84]KAF1844720.1 hypothetical protein K460DRAFT_97459 [Cucurbitaria berberidis CBS 394.84]
MFELPGAKRVRRDELQSPASSPRSSPDPALEDLLRSQIRNEYAFTTAEIDTTEAAEAAHSDGEEEVELRLFAATPNAPLQTTKIRLSSPGIGTGEPGFVVKKPRSYYFADEPSSEEEAALQAAAIDGKTVLELSRDPWPGCALPWKVRTISAAGMKKEVLIGHPPTLVTVEEEEHKRKRKGKKTRIALRKKRQATKEKQDERARLAQEKDEAEREKRTRRNREKKVKKKAKAKAKKASDGAVEGEAHDTDTEQEALMHT